MVLISRFRSVWGIDSGPGLSNWRKLLVEWKAHGYSKTLDTSARDSVKLTRFCRRRWHRSEYQFCCWVRRAAPGAAKALRWGRFWGCGRVSINLPNDISILILEKKHVLVYATECRTSSAWFTPGRASRVLSRATASCESTETDGYYFAVWIVSLPKSQERMN